MIKLVRDIQMLGGIASKAELLRLGNDADTIRLFSDHGGLIRRIRKGWYCTPELEPRVFEAFRIGGRLACVSAAAFHGLVPWPATDEIHVALHRQSSRLRTRSNPRARLSDNPDPGVVRHWSRKPLTGSRKAVSPEEAVAQMSACQPVSVSRSARRALATR
jgi:hypothetical protein